MQVAMRVFICTDHEGVWPVGTASVVVADNEVAARGFLLQALRKKGLDGYTNFTLTELDLRTPGAHVLRDEDY